MCVCAEPNTPGKFIVWFRNETTLLVLWQPPYPPGFYTHYKVRGAGREARPPPPPHYCRLLPTRYYVFVILDLTP